MKLHFLSLLAIASFSVAAFGQASVDPAKPADSGTAHKAAAAVPAPVAPATPEPAKKRHFFGIKFGPGDTAPTTIATGQGGFTGNPSANGYHSDGMGVKVGSGEANANSTISPGQGGYSGIHFGGSASATGGSLDTGHGSIPIPNAGTSAPASGR